MKTILFKILLLTVVIFCGIMPLKADYTKKVHKSWPLNSVNSLSVENKFGDINFINTRDDSVTIDVVIEIKGVSESKAEMIADIIEFEFSLNEGRVNAETIFLGNFKGKNEFNILYTINIPINKFISVNNKFGNVTLGDLTSGGDFEISYGNIFGKTLVAPGNGMIDLELKYGNATFEKINSLDAEIEYSKFYAEAIGNGELETRYSTVEMQKCLNLVSDSQYDNYSIRNAENLLIDSKFSAWKVEELKSILEMVNEYGDVFINHVSKDFEKIKVDNKFGNINIFIDPDASYYLRSDTQFCETKHPEGNIKKHIKDDNKTYTEVVIGNENPVSNVDVISKYGKVDLME